MTSPTGPSRTLPPSVVAAVVAISVAPFGLGLLGIDFGTANTPIEPGTTATMDAVFAAARGPMVHTLLEWSAVGIAACTVVLAALYMQFRDNLVPPVVALALFAAAALDGFHVLAADRLLEGSAPPADLVPFTWALSRSFNVLILMVGVALVWRTLDTKPEDRQSPFRSVVGAGGVFLLLSYAVIAVSAATPNLPQTTYPDASITRPWDIVPLGLFAFAGVFVFPALHRRAPSVFTHALVVSTVPDIVVQLHMALGSTALFDHHFNIAHFLKILGYGVPLAGLCVEFSYLFQQDRDREQQLNDEMAARAEMAEQLVEARERAQHASQAKSEFLANMSHEIRTPMNGVIGMAQLLLDTPLEATQLKHAQTLAQSADHLMMLLNDILDISKIEAGKLDIEVISFNLRNMVAAALASHRTIARRRGLNLKCEIRDDVPNRVMGDPTRLTQVLVNLVSNAIKFTEEGSVTVRVSAQSDGMYSFSVQDSGIGIAPERVDHIFSAFTQAEGSTTRRFGGTGLGLSISQKLVALMGGQLTVSSLVKVGTVFTFTAKLGEAQDTPAETPDSVHWADRETETQSLHIAANRSIPSLLILVAEDHPVNQVLVRAMLEKAGHRVSLVANGRAAVDAAMAHNWDVVLMDVQMPIMDGLQATRMLREKGYDRPIIALTAQAMSGDRQRCIEAGMDEYVSKPIRLDELNAALAKTCAVAAK